MSSIRNITVSNDFRRYHDFIRSLPKTFDCSGTLLYRERNTVKSFVTDGTTLVVKRYKRPNIVQRVAYTFFKKSKAERAYIFARMLRDRGISTPREAAYIEMRDGIMMSDSYFVSESCTLPALSTLLRRPDFDRSVAGSLAEFLVRLHERGVLHGDLNLTNILYDMQPDGRCTFTLIDTNRSKFRQPSHSDCIENLTRLTHDEALMTFVIGRYAAIRGWDSNSTVSEVARCLHRFERRRELKRKLKAVFSRKRKP